MLVMGATLSVWWLLSRSCVDRHTLKGAVVGKREKEPLFVGARGTRRAWGHPVWRAPFARRGVPGGGVGETKAEVKQKKEKNGVRLCEILGRIWRLPLFVLGYLYILVNFFPSAGIISPGRATINNTNVELKKSFPEPGFPGFDSFSPNLPRASKQSKVRAALLRWCEGVPLARTKVMCIMCISSLPNIKYGTSVLPCVTAAPKKKKKMCMHGWYRMAFFLFLHL